MREFTTPMMKQYMAIKRQYEDCLLFFRLGDFYELFLEDATLGAKTLDITLTQRPSGKDGHIPMAGVPYHAADAYIAKLIKAGYKVAICEQLSEPDSRGLVDRDVVRIVTPGTVVDEKTLDQKEHNYVMSVSWQPAQVGLAFADISTGDFQVVQLAGEPSTLEPMMMNEIIRFQPVECIVSPAAYADAALLRVLRRHRGLNIYPFATWEEVRENAPRVLERHFRVGTVASFGLQDRPYALEAAAALVGYLTHTQKKTVHHLQALQLYQPENSVMMDQATMINLELFSTIRERAATGSLVDLLDLTATAMGGRLFRDWLKKPLLLRHHIQDRLNAVEELIGQRSRRVELQKILGHIYDIERIISRLSLGVGNAGDLINLKNSLADMMKIKENLRQATSSLLMRLEADIAEVLSEVITLMSTRIVDHPPLDVKAGGLIKPGVSSDLDELRQIVQGGHAWLAELETTERQKTGIGSLKVRFNQVFGYYIEVSKPNLHLVPAGYTRKQSMVNAERFITPELKSHEETILKAQEKINRLEYGIFLETVELILRHLPALQQAAHGVASLDCLISFAQVAERDNYCKPTVNEAGEIHIQAGRHPMVEKLLANRQFVPNDVVLNTDDHQLVVLTGPNMAGKSVFMRQVALITVMAQVGMFVPAARATISIVDRIFVRSGAADAITAGLSTFMVEMVETAYILHNATSKSLIIMDEIGRGTSTYDGMSIAWAVAEYLVASTPKKAKTLFATHYHELQALEDSYPDSVKNYQMVVADNKGEPVFLHQVAPGRASHSYAVAVAKLAGLPKSVTQRATQILAELEDREGQPVVSRKVYG